MVLRAHVVWDNVRTPCEPLASGARGSRAISPTRKHHFDFHACSVPATTKVCLPSPQKGKKSERCASAFFSPREPFCLRASISFIPINHFAYVGAPFSTNMRPKVRTPLPPAREQNVKSSSTSRLRTRAFWFLLLHFCVVF